MDGGSQIANKCLQCTIEQTNSGHAYTANAASQFVNDGIFKQAQWQPTSQCDNAPGGPLPIGRVWICFMNPRCVKFVSRCICIGDANSIATERARVLTGCLAYILIRTLKTAETLSCWYRLNTTQPRPQRQDSINVPICGSYTESRADASIWASLWTAPSAIGNNLFFTVRAVPQNCESMLVTNEH